MNDNIVDSYSRKIESKKEKENTKQHDSMTNNPYFNKNKSIQKDFFQENLFNKQAKLKLTKKQTFNNTEHLNSNSLLNYSKNEKFKKLEINTDFNNYLKANKKTEINNLQSYTAKNITNSIRKSPGKIKLLKFKKSTEKNNESKINKNDELNYIDNKSKQSDITISNVKYFGVNNSFSNNINSNFNTNTKQINNELSLKKQNDYYSRFNDVKILKDNNLNSSNNYNYNTLAEDKAFCDNINKNNICINSKANLNTINISNSNNNINVVKTMNNSNNLSNNDIKFNKYELKTDMTIANTISSVDFSNENAETESKAIFKKFMSIEDEAKKSTIKQPLATTSIKSPTNDLDKKNFSSNLLNYKIRNYSNKNQNRSKSRKNTMLQNFKDFSSLKKNKMDYLDSPNFDERIKNSFQFRDNKSFKKSPNKFKEAIKFNITNNTNNSNYNNSKAENKVILNTIGNEMQKKSFSNFKNVNKNFLNSNNGDINDNDCNNEKMHNFIKTEEAKKININAYDHIYDYKCNLNNNANKTAFLRNSYSNNFKLRKRSNNTSSNKLSISIANKTEILDNLGNKVLFDYKNNKQNKSNKNINNSIANDSLVNRTETNDAALLEIKNEIIEKVKEKSNTLNSICNNNSNPKANIVENKINNFFDKNAKKYFSIKSKNEHNIINNNNNKTIDYEIKRKSQEIPFSIIKTTFQDKNVGNALNHSTKNFNNFSRSPHEKVIIFKQEFAKNLSENDSILNCIIKKINKVDVNNQTNYQNFKTNDKGTSQKLSFADSQTVENPKTHSNEKRESTFTHKTRYLSNSNQKLKNQMKTKSSFGEDVSSEPETIISSSANYIKENLNFGISENSNIKKQIKTIERNFEIFITEKYSKNKNSKIKINEINNNQSAFNSNNNSLFINSPNYSEKFSEFSENNYKNFFVCKKFLGEIFNINPAFKRVSEKMLMEIENNYAEIFSKFKQLNEKLSYAYIYREKYIKINNLYEQVCRQKREKDNEISELLSRIRYLESFNNKKSLNNSHLQNNFYTNNTYSNTNTTINNLNNNNLNNNNNRCNYSNNNSSISNVADNIPTYKETKEYNLTFNYNMLNNISQSNDTNNGCESRDPQQSILTYKNSHISGFKYDRGFSQSMDSLSNNSKTNLKNYFSICNSNKNIINLNNVNNYGMGNLGINMSNTYNRNNKNNFNGKNCLGNCGLFNSFENESKNAKIFSTFDNTKNNYKIVKKTNIDSNLSGFIIKSNTDDKNIDKLTLQNRHFNKKIINNISTNKNIFIYNSSQNIEKEINQVTNVSFIEEKDKDLSICFKNKKDNSVQNKLYNRLNSEFENEINSKNKNTKNNNDLKNQKDKVEKFEFNKVKKFPSNEDDLDDIVFPDKVVMTSVLLKKELPKLHLNFNNKSVDLQKHKKVTDFASNDYTDSYNIDLDNTSFILNDKSRARDKSLEIKKFDFDSKIKEKEEIFKAINRDKNFIIMQLQGK